MFSYSPKKTTIDEMVQESMFGLIKAKTGITKPIQIRMIEYCTTYTKKTDGRISISSILVKRRILPFFERISENEIKFSGATNNEFVEYLRAKGAKQVVKKQEILDRI